MSPSSGFNDFGQPVGVTLARWVPPPLPPRSPIGGRYCRVEPIDERYAGDLYAAASQDADGRTWTYIALRSLQHGIPLPDWLMAPASATIRSLFAIVDAADGKAAGLASYLNIKPMQGSIEVGHVYFSPALQRTRLATEAMYLMMRRAFELGYRRYEWKCDALNAASRAAAERLGLSYEGIFRQATVYKRRNRYTARYAAVDGDVAGRSRPRSRRG